MAPWVPGPAAKTSMPRDNEGERWLCSLLMSTQSLWFCIWNRDVKRAAHWTVKKKLSRITQVRVYLCQLLLLFLPRRLFTVIIKVIVSQDWNGKIISPLSVSQEVLFRIICLKCRFLAMGKMMFEIIFWCRDAGYMRERGWHAGKAESDLNWQP